MLQLVLITVGLFASVSGITVESCAPQGLKVQFGAEFCEFDASSSGSQFIITYFTRVRLLHLIHLSLIWRASPT